MKNPDTAQLWKEHIERSGSHISYDEFESILGMGAPAIDDYGKAFLDAAQHGQGFMKDGNHIARNEVFKQPDELWLDKIARELHYPNCWDTTAYPTIWDAIYEIAKCSGEHPPKKGDL